MKKTTFYDEIAKNKRNSILLVILIFSFLIGLVWIISQILAPELSLIFLVFAGIIMLLYTYGTYMYGDRIVLAATGAKLVDEDDRRYTHLINVVEGLSIAAGVPRPKIYVIESDEINAFATGRDYQHSSVAVTTGLLKNLKRNEIEGVIGHEISHIRNYDIRFATFVAVLVGLVAILSDMLLRTFWYGGRREKEEKGGVGLLLLIGFILAIFAPIVTRLVQFAISRKREFLADASSAELTRYPEGLASALEKIMKINEGKMKVSEAVSHLFFVDPNRSALDSLYATHPDIRERIKILRSM
ncbi:MAG: M48 family metallopeptidase [Candidatus Aenigmarchaeota archaeon]|nr:M48 family metallopeptidase [Candidatus Aenigmarchaeota archaeon]